MRVNAVLVGTGIFAKDVYISLFRKYTAEAALYGVWSRTQHNAAAFAKLVDGFAATTRCYHGDTGLEEILSDHVVDVVVVVLPVQAALHVVQRALVAGKHVIQEKPVGPSVASVLPLLQEHMAQSRSLWMLAENYRFENVFHASCNLVQRLGAITKLDMIADMPMDAKNKYFGSTWRRDTEGCPGGFLMDMSVHYIAALRMVAAACGLGEISTTSAIALQAAPDISNPDTLVGVVAFATGVPASVSISVAAAQLRFSLTVVGSRGSLEVSRGGWGGSRGEYTLTHRCMDAEAVSVECFPFSGCDNEFSSFMAQICTFNSAHMRGRHCDGVVAAQPTSGDSGLAGSPLEGLRDLAVMEALLRSSAIGGQRVEIQKLVLSTQG